MQKAKEIMLQKKEEKEKVRKMSESKWQPSRLLGCTRPPSVNFFTEDSVGSECSCILSGESDKKLVNSDKEEDLSSRRQIMGSRTNSLPQHVNSSSDLS